MTCLDQHNEDSVPCCRPISGRPSLVSSSNADGLDQPRVRISELCTYGSRSVVSTAQHEVSSPDIAIKVR